MNARFGVGDLLGEMRALAGQHLPFVLAAGIVQLAIYTASDMASPQISMIVASIAGLVIDYAVLQRLLGRWGERWRFGSVFAAQMITGLGILLGLLLLVLPGLFLMARWSLAPAFVIAEENRSREAVAASWRATAQCWLPIAVVYVINGAILGAVLFALDHWLERIAELLPPSLLPLAETATPNLFATFYAVVGSLVTAAAFRLSRSEANGLDNVFA